MNKFVYFILGAATGAAVTFKIVSDKYQQMYEKDLESIKSAYSKNDEKPTKEEPKKPEAPKAKEDIHEKVTNAKREHMKEKSKYKDYTSMYQNKESLQFDEDSDDVDDDSEDDILENPEGEPDNKVPGPRVISPRVYFDIADEYEQDYGYKTFDLLYFADHVLTDDENAKITDVEGIVGRESLNHFGEYEEDSVYVQNDDRKAFYVILLDERKYSDVEKQMPPYMSR